MGVRSFHYAERYDSRAAVCREVEPLDRQAIVWTEIRGIPRCRRKRCYATVVALANPEPKWPEGHVEALREAGGREKTISYCIGWGQRSRK